MITIYTLYIVSLVIPLFGAIIAKSVGRNWKKGIIVGLIIAGVYNLVDFIIFPGSSDWHGISNVIGATFALIASFIYLIVGIIGSKMKKN